MVSFVPLSGQVSGKPSGPSHLKQLIGRTAFGAVLLTACLHAGAASALSFNFSFSGFGDPTAPSTVTGIVDGLVDNLDDQVSGITVTIVSATNETAKKVFTDVNYQFGQGFDVSGGVITGASIRYGVNTDTLLALGNQGNYFFIHPALMGPCFTVTGGFLCDNTDFDVSSSNSLRFTPVAPDPVTSVPGPLPLFGAGAAFGWSRRLRRRIKAPA